MSKMAGCSIRLSQELDQVLDLYGFSRTFIDCRRKIFNFFHELSFHNVSNDTMLCFFAGSKRDALCSLWDRNSDTDMIVVHPALVIDETKKHNVKHLTKMATLVPVFSLEKGRYPGYCYLKYLVSNEEYFKKLSLYFTQVKGNIYFSNIFKETFIGLHDTANSNVDVHGPAIQQTHIDNGIGTSDYVTALHCHYLPSDYDEWCNRKRHYSWPPDWIIEATKRFGCLVVPVGHSESDTQVIEWRLSLNKTEYLLTKSFNHVQMKCYVMMKLVLKWIVQPQIKETLSSYHVKTVMFWMSEERDEQFWRPENLADCFISSITKLRTYVENKNCPSYFLTDVNLLHGKLEGDIHHRVLEILDGIIAKGPVVVYQCLPLDASVNEAHYRHGKEESCTCLYKHLIEKRLDEMAYLFSETARKSTSSVKTNAYRSSMFGLVDWHNFNEFHNKSIGDSLIFSSIAVCEKMGLSNKRFFYLQRDYISMLRGSGFVARIKLATLLYYRQRLGYCIPVLSLVIKSMESSREFEICTEECDSEGHIEEIGGVECIYLTQNNKGFRVSEIVFSPCDQHLIPSDLQNEMRRPKTVNGTHYEGWVFVDSIVYAYYLLIVTLHDMRRYSGITSWLKRFRNVCTQQPGAIRIFRRDMAKRLYEHAFMLVWAATKGFNKLLV